MKVLSENFSNFKRVLKIWEKPADKFQIILNKILPKFLENLRIYCKIIKENFELILGNVKVNFTKILRKS